MAKNPFYDQAAHWYYPDGKPAHEIDGHKTGMRDVRKHNLLPSVTNILSVIAKPGLDAWKQKNAALAALKSPFGEDEGATLTWIAEEAKKSSMEAAELGTQWHKDIEGWVTAIESGGDAPQWFWDMYNDLGVTMQALESPFCCNEYGGTIDFVGWSHKHECEVLIDWKTQKTDRGVNWYKQWPMQLAAYAYGCGSPNAKLINVVISTTESEHVKVREWSDNRMWYEAFMDVYEVWCGPLGKNYRP